MELRCKRCGREVTIVYGRKGYEFCVGCNIKEMQEKKVKLDPRDDNVTQSKREDR